MQIGGHVSAAGGLLPALDRGAAIDADVIQIFVQSPRTFKATAHPIERLDAYRAAQLEHERVHATFAHAPYLINLATENVELAQLSVDGLTHNLATTTAIGGSGVVLHVGSHRGHGLEAVLNQVVDAMRVALDQACERSGGEVCQLLLENAAGSVGTIGRSFEELAMLIDAADNDPRLGTCIDTQHLFASGVAYGTLEEANQVMEMAEETFGLDRIGLIHLNDSKVAFGSNRDRHENFGAGEIGTTALGSLLSHPQLADIPVVLEVPGDGDGPRLGDVVQAKTILKNGLARRARAAKPKSSSR